MENLSLFLVIGAIICFVLVTLGVNVPRVNLLGLGLALWAASTIV